LRALHKQRPRLDFAVLRHRLRAIRVVEIQYRSLRKDVRRAKAGRMIGVPFDFRRAPLVAFHEQPDGVCTKRHRRGIKLRLAESQSIGLLDVRHDVLFRRAAAAGEARESKRCRHQLQEIAPVDAVVPFRRGLAGEFAVKQLCKLRIARKLLERPPVLLARFRLELGADSSQIHRAFVQLHICGRIVVLAVQVFVLFVLAHNVH